MSPNVWFISQLALIPQVTEKISSKILLEYPTISALIFAYEKLPLLDRQHMLSNIKYDIKGEKQRKIGNKISDRIYKFCYGII